MTGLTIGTLKLRDEIGNIYEPSCLHGPDAQDIYTYASQASGVSKEYFTESHFLTNFKNAINPYPVGAIYISGLEVSPAKLFGGNWERIIDVFLLCAGTTYAAGIGPDSTSEYIGEETHILSSSEMPSHTHKLYVTNGTTTGSTMETYANCINNGGYTFSSTGENQAHNNMPPFITKNIWKRVS